MIMCSFKNRFSPVRTLDTKADLERGVPWMLSNKDISIKEAKNTCVLCPAIYDTKVLLHLTFLPLRIQFQSCAGVEKLRVKFQCYCFFVDPTVQSKDAWDLCSSNPSNWLDHLP